MGFTGVEQRPRRIVGEPRTCEHEFDLAVVTELRQRPFQQLAGRGVLPVVEEQESVGSQRQRRALAGLDETLCRCDALWLVEKSKLTKKRGTVAVIRRRQIVDKINASMGWKLV